MRPLRPRTRHMELIPPPTRRDLPPYHIYDTGEEVADWEEEPARHSILSRDTYSEVPFDFRRNVRRKNLKKAKQNRGQDPEEEEEETDEEEIRSSEEEEVDEHPYEEPEDVKDGPLVYQLWKPRKDRDFSIRNHVCCKADREDFLTHLAEALLAFGAPPHRITSILNRAATILETEMELFLFSSAVFVSFGSHTTELRIFGATNLEMIAKVQDVFRGVIHDRAGADDGTVELISLIEKATPLKFSTKVACAFACSFAIGPIAFGSSFIDMWFGAVASALLVWSQGVYSARNPDGAGMFRIAAIICVSLFARGLATVPGGYFCYEAISSSGVVMILPGYSMLTAVLELMTGTTIVGAVRMIDSLWATLTLSFSLTIGSKLLLGLIPASKRAFDRVLSNQFSPKITLAGICNMVDPPRGGNSTISLALTYSNNTIPLDPKNIVAGCLREPEWQWWNRALPWWSLFFFVPMFSLCISIAQGQRVWTKNMLIMICISCASYVVNTVVTRLIFKHGDLVAISGAFVVGVSAHVYSRVWGGYAFCVSLTGILFLVPSGLSDSGGLASYSDSTNGYLTNSLAAGLRMIKVATLLALGLQLATWVVYMFGSNKRGTFFAF